jgi:hypothetical protein
MVSGCPWRGFHESLGWVGLFVGAGAVLAAYAEWVMDIRSPHSDLSVVRALGASAHLSMVKYNKKVEQMRNAYGDRAHVILEASTGKTTVTLDDRTIEESQIVRQFGGMYGVFVVKARDVNVSIFPFALDPGEIPSDHEPNIARLQSRFEKGLVAGYLTFNDTDWTRDSCAAPPVSDLGFGSLAALLRLKSGTFCLVNWKGPRPGSMLIGVARAEGDPWMRPFARWICRKLTAAALDKLSSRDRKMPTYAACVMVDRPDRTGSPGAQDAFTSIVYEVQDGASARLD